MKIGVLGKISKVKDQSIIDGLLQYLKDCGHQTVLFHEPTEIVGVDVAVILGGDGAILHSAVTAAKNGVKIVGINYGNLGFLTEYEKEEGNAIRDLLADLQENRCRILKRSLLEVEIAGECYYALNEVAFQRDSGLYVKSNTQILKIKVHTNEGTDEIAGDGLLFCTPTGSTAYSLSAGGAILTPEVPVFMMTPLCAFSMRTRPVVFSDSQEIALKIASGKAIVSIDGQAVIGLPENAVVFIRKAPFTADFPVREQTDFFAKVRNKLNK